MKIAVISGSNKTKEPSLNNALVEVVKNLNVQDVEFEELDIKNLPLYSQDYDEDFPEVARNFKKQLEEADGVVLVTPEYNRATTPVLANAIAWSSRPYPDNVWADKPVITMGATGGSISTFAAQANLRQILLHVEALIVPTSVYVGFSADKMTDGKFTDEKTVAAAKEAVEKLVHIIQKLNS